VSTAHAYLVGLVGTGVTPSLTPRMHMAEARAHGVTYIHRPIDLTPLGISPDRIGEILDWAQRLGFDALNITHPCKQLVLPHLDRVVPLAADLGAVNTVLFTPTGRVGHNTDTTGYAEAFRTGLAGAARAAVVQVGAGGAGSAVAEALLREGVTALTIVDLSLVRAGSLVADLRLRHPEARIESAAAEQLPSLLATADGVVNCTPTGMADRPGTPFDVALLRPELWVSDIVYRPFDTALLIAARARGCRTLDGGGMAVRQAADAFELITGLHADVERMSEHLRQLVTTDHILT
jgi:shikimate dehydrogenase